MRRAYMFRGEIKNGNPGLHICKFTIRTPRHRFFWPGYWLLHLGWSVAVWISQGQSGSKPEPGSVGLLDAWLHAVSHRHLSADRTNMVQRLRQNGLFSSVYGGPRVHGLW